MTLTLIHVYTVQERVSTMHYYMYFICIE